MGLGVGVVAFSPLGRGMLTGALPGNVPADSRAAYPRFNAEHVAHNRAVAEQIAAFAETRGVSPAQLTLAWLLARGDDVVPIPGTQRRGYLEDNVAAADVALDDTTWAELERLANQVEGDRSPDMASLAVDTPPLAS